MEVALLVSNNAGSQCVRLGVIEKCSFRGIWCGFLVSHSFFVVVNVTKVNTKYNGQTTYCEEKTIKTLGAVINHKVLWSGYKVRPTEPLCPSRNYVVKQEDIGGPLIQFQPEKDDNDFFSLDINTTNSDNELGRQGVGAQKKVDKGDIESDNVYPDRPLWRSKICDLLNDDFTFFGKAKIIVCLPDKPFDEKNLGDTNARVFFFFWMGTFR